MPVVIISLVQNSGESVSNIIKVVKLEVHTHRSASMPTIDSEHFCVPHHVPHLLDKPTKYEASK